MTIAITSLRTIASLSAAQGGSAGLGTVSQNVNQSYQLAFSNGSGAKQASKLWTDHRTVAGTDALDLAGVLLDAFGQMLTFATIKGVLMKAADDNAAALVIGGTGSSFLGWFGGVNDTESLDPGGLLLHVTPSADGWPVTAGTGDTLQIAGDGSYDIMIFGD